MQHSDSLRVFVCVCVCMCVCVCVGVECPVAGIGARFVRFWEYGWPREGFRCYSDRDMFCDFVFILLICTFVPAGMCLCVLVSCPIAVATVYGFGNKENTLSVILIGFL